MAFLVPRRTRRGVVFHVAWFDKDGRQRQKSLKTSDPHMAEVWRQQIELREEGRAPVQALIGAAEALHRFLAHVRLTRSLETHRYYEAHLGRLWTAWAAIPLERWCRPMLERYIADHPGWSPRTTQMLVNACRRVVKWSREVGIGMPDFVGTFRGPTVHRAEPISLSREDRDALLDAAAGHALEPAIALACLAGLRPYEVVRFRSRDIDWKGSTLLVRGQKTHRDRRLPMSSRLLEILKPHRKVAGPMVRFGGEDNHSNRRRGLHLLCARASVPAITWRELRHTYGTQLAAEGVDLPTIQALMGHASGATTTRYLHTDPKRLAAAVERIA